MGGLEHEPVEFGAAVAGFHLDGDGRNPAGGLQAGDVGLAEGAEEFAAVVEQGGDGRVLRCGSGIDEIAAGE
jgi:hypothetical protein